MEKRKEFPLIEIISSMPFQFLKGIRFIYNQNKFDTSEFAKASDYQIQQLIQSKAFKDSHGYLTSILLNDKRNAARTVCQTFDTDDQSMIKRLHKLAILKGLMILQTDLQIGSNLRPNLH